MMKKPLLSIGMIVKNEIRCLEKCLKALQPLRAAIPCELVIADTGSIDGTRELAEKYADILFDFEWINDFAAARNAVIKRCSGKWYMSVDADEYLEPEIDELVEFLTKPLPDEVRFASYIIRNYLDKDMKELSCDLSAPRIARMHPGLHYTGAIHELFASCDTDKQFLLNKTIFHHDGYAPVTPEHTRKKADRNLALLEPLLERDPHNLKLLLQTLESAGMQKVRSAEFARRGMKEIMSENCTDERYSSIAPAVAKECFVCAACSFLPEVEEWYRWIAQQFPASDYKKIDVNFYYLYWLYKNERYREMLTVCDEYFETTYDYQQDNMISGQAKMSAIICSHPIRINLTHLMVAEAYQTEGNVEKMLEHFSMADLLQHENATFPRWFTLLEKNADFSVVREALVHKILPFYEKRESGSDEEKQLWRKVFACMERAFAIEREKAHTSCQLYGDLPGTVGICARLVHARNAEDGQALLDRIEDWSMMMPLALKKAVELRLVFPDEFYRVLPERLHGWENAIAQNDSDAVESVLHYTELEQITDWHRLCFAFDFLCAICMRKDGIAGEYGDALSDRFAQVGALFLQEYYNPNVIANEDAIDRLPALHRFTWYYVRAVELRLEDDWAGYVTELRKALAEAEAMKPFVQYLLGDVQERQKRERIAAASPELIALAEQVKAILAQYPADDPTVAALKQTPAYQQVAFLIEE